MNDEYLSAVSTHTFLWAFTYSEKKNEFNPAKRVWHEDDALQLGSGDDFMDAYMIAQYFNKTAREIFAGPIQADVAESRGNALPQCRRFCYAPEIVRRLKYRIQPLGNLRYELHVHRIRLFLFRSCGVGVLSIETYNKEHRSLADIKRINDLGRRIRLPFLPRTLEGFILCAEQLGIVCDGSERWVTDFRQLAKTALKTVQNGDSPQCEKLLQPPDFICGFLSGKIGTDEGAGELPEKLVPASDDRMFLVSLIKNSDLSSLGKSWRKFEEQDSDLLYSVVFADPDEATCKDEMMRSKLLEKAIYPRWSNYGTLYAMTNLSVMCLTNDADIVDSVYRPFLTEYTAMAVLVLVQRVSIESFARESSEIVQGAEQRGLLKPEQIENMIDLHERYVTWQNQINLFEVTDQEQGIEMYARMREQMGVNGRIGHLAEQLEDMYAIANVNQNTRTNQSVVWWAYAAIVINICLSGATFLLELTEGGKGFREAEKAIDCWHRTWDSLPGILQPLGIGLFILAILFCCVCDRKKNDAKNGK